ncbi:MAG: glycosyltransferase family 4 protein [Bryobacteraceae bacterium]|nr:glycosyltransferase family 4 protein [Bryobacteraceae bacterium]
MVVQKAASTGRIMLDNGIEVVSIACPTRSWSDFLFALKSRRIAATADLCGYLTPELGFPFYAQNSFAVQHGIWWDGPGYRSIRGFMVRSIQSLRNWWLVHRVGAVVCVDTNFINYLRANGIAGPQDLRKCSYVPNYADIGLSREPSIEKIHQRWGRRSLLFLRRFEPQRGVDLFIRMCQLLHLRGIAFQARMIGDGSLKEHARGRISALGLDRIVSIGACAFDEVYCELDEASISIVPTEWSEGTSLSAAESIVSGVPVIATNVGGLANLIVPEFNGLLVAPAAEELADAAALLLGDRDKYTDYALACLSMRHALSRDRWRREITCLLTRLGLIQSPETLA